MPIADLGEKPSHVGAADPYYPNNLRFAVRSHDVDLRLAAADQVNMRQFVIREVDDEPKSMRPMHDNH